MKIWEEEGIEKKVDGVERRGERDRIEGSEKEKT
jgi:hypothetical protein